MPSLSYLAITLKCEAKPSISCQQQRLPNVSQYQSLRDGKFAKPFTFGHYLLELTNFPSSYTSPFLPTLPLTWRSLYQSQPLTMNGNDCFTLMFFLAIGLAISALLAVVVCQESSSSHQQGSSLSFPSCVLRSHSKCTSSLTIHVALDECTLL